MAKKSPFIIAADSFEKWAKDFEAVAHKEKYGPRKAAILREVAHYLECAARLRGTPLTPLSLKKQYQATAR